MDYSVGSLADLISGKKTPNKPKVVSATFVPLKKEPEESSTKTNFSNTGGPKTPKKKFIKSADNVTTKTPKLQYPKKPNKKQRKLKGATTVIANLDESDTLDLPVSIEQNGTGKIKKASKPKDSENSLESKPKGKKRKLEASSSDLADTSMEEATAKKPKPSKNDQNAASRIKNKINQENKHSSEYNDRTIFVGNVPVSVTKKKIKQHFVKYGPIESIRFRGIAVADPKTTKKVAAIKKEFHPDRNTIHAYIRFLNSDDAKKAEAENGEIFLEHHLRVNCCEATEKPDESKAIFVGNIPFSAEDEELWNLFKPCGPIAHVRIVRDGRTGMGKGFGYVNFKDSDSVQLALEMEKVVFKERELRISSCDINRSKKKKLGKKPGTRNLKSKNDEGDGEGQKKKIFKKETKGAFSGTKFNDIKKKKKANKGILQKKKIAKKLEAKPHQPQKG